MYDLTIEIAEGKGTTNPPEGVNEFKANTEVQISAHPDVGYEFGYWVGDVTNPNVATTTVYMDEDQTVIVHFKAVEDEIDEILEKVDLNVPMTIKYVDEIIPLVDDKTDKLLGMLENGTALERWAAAYSFQRVTLPATVLNELETYLTDRNNTIKALIATAFLKNGDNKGKAPLISLLGSNEIMMFSVPPEELGAFALKILHTYFPGEYTIDKYVPLTTSVTGGPCEYKVTVKIVFHGNGASQTQINSWETEAEEIWNGDEGSREWGGEGDEEDCCTVEFDFVFEIVTDGNFPDDAHVVEIKKVNVAHTSFVNTPLPTPGSTETTTGEFDSLDTGTVVAHELGHFMGLDDEYHYDEDGNYVNDNEQDEDPQSIMAQTWGNVSALPEHVDKIMSDAEIECDCDYSITMTPIYDINISPGMHTVKGVVTKADGNPAEGKSIEVTVTGLHAKGPDELTTDQNGEVTYSYKCTQICHTGLDVITMTGECNASDVVLKEWICIQKLFPIPEWPFDGQEDFPYETPTVTIDVSPTTAWKADNFAMKVVITKDSTVFETTTSTTTLEIPDLEPGTEYSLTLTPLNTDFDGEGNILKGNSVDITFETAVPTPEYVEPPENMKADLSASDTSIRSHEFAKMIEDNIVDKGYKQMIFAFGQCFGGGMFEDLKDFDDTLLKSAARWNETSWGNDGLGYDYWLEELRKEFESGDTVAKADYDAYMNDPRGPHGDRDNPPGTEHPQGLYNGDQNMRLTDDASSKHALLFSGSDEPRHQGDIEKWETTLTSTPLGFDVISVVGGTKDDLETALASISSQMNSNEIFLFMSSGHGSEATEIAEQVDVCPVEGGGIEFTPTTEILDIAEDANLENLYIEFDVLDDWDIPYEVYLNDFPLGISNPEVVRNSLPVGFEMINWEDYNYLYFNPLEPCPDSRMIHDIYLGTGAVPTVNDE